MLIACPNCATRYNIDPAIIGAGGRKVRCSQCTTVWVQTLPNDGGSDPDDAPVAEPGGIDRGNRTPADEPFGSADPDPRPSNPTAPSPDPAAPPPDPKAPPRRRSPARAASPPADYAYPDFDSDIEAAFESSRGGGDRRWWLLAAVGVLLLGAAVLLLKEQIVAIVPGDLYEIMGLEDDAPGDVWDVQTKPPQPLGDGSRRLVISGVITNTADKDLAVPTLEATLLNAAGDTLRSWEFTADSVIVLGGDRTTFRTEFSHESQPGDHVVITFVDD